MIPGTFLQLFSIYDIYGQWEASGVFDFVLPMLLIFAVVFGILMSTKVLGGDRGPNFLVAAAASIMAMRLTIVSDFFSLIFPGLGIGIAVLVTVLILAGLFMDKANYKTWLPVFFWGGLVIGLVVAVSSLNSIGWFGSAWWQANWISVLWIVILFAVLAPLFIETEKPKQTDFSGQFKALRTSSKNNP
jgi:uncharacterized protein YacL